MHKNDRLRPWETALLAAVCVTLLTGVWAQGRQSALADKVVRLHVIAASDSAEDQRVNQHHAYIAIPQHCIPVYPYVYSIQPPSRVD